MPKILFHTLLGYLAVRGYDIVVPGGSDEGIDFEKFRSGYESIGDFEVEAETLDSTMIQATLPAGPQVTFIRTDEKGTSDERYHAMLILGAVFFHNDTGEGVQILLDMEHRFPGTINLFFKKLMAFREEYGGCCVDLDALFGFMVESAVEKALEDVDSHLTGEQKKAIREVQISTDPLRWQGSQESTLVQARRGRGVMPNTR